MNARNIAQGRGVALVVGSLIDQLLRGITLLPLADPTSPLIIDLWYRETTSTALTHILTAARALSIERHWLSHAS